MEKNDFQYGGGIITPCNVACTWLWNRDNVIRGSGMTCHWIRPNDRHFGILHLVSISTTSPQSTCHSAPVSEILSKSDNPRQKKNDIMSIFQMTISAILDFRGPIIRCGSKTTGPLQLIRQNFTNSQHSLIIFGTEIPYSILHWLW